MQIYTQIKEEILNGIIKEVVDSGIYYQWIEEASQLSNEIQGVK